MQTHIYKIHKCYQGNLSFNKVKSDILFTRIKGFHLTIHKSSNCHVK